MHFDCHNASKCVKGIQFGVLKLFLGCFNFHGRCPLGRGRHNVKILYVCLCLTLLSGDSARRRQTSYDVATLLLMAPIDPWQNSTPDFGALAFCTTNIEDFRTPLTSTSSTISSTYSSQKWTSSKRKIMELI